MVLDASAVLEWLLQTPVGSQVEQRALKRGTQLCVPHLLDVEIAQVLRRFAGMGLVSAARGSEALEDLQALPLTRYPHDLFLPRIWQLRHNLTAYDAAYVALAEYFSTSLLTRDRRLASSKGHQARIELF